MSWDEWIALQESDIEKKIYKSTYDVLAELCASSYNLKDKSRKAHLKDRRHFFILWWYENVKKMKYYTTSVRIAELLEIDHSTIIHYKLRRKPTILYEENTKCINDFLNS